jgi:hypothetical protein
MFELAGISCVMKGDFSSQQPTRGWAQISLCNFVNTLLKQKLRSANSLDIRRRALQVHLMLGPPHPTN